MTRKDAAGYEKHRDQMAAASKARSVAGRDLGEIPPCANPARRAAASKSFRLFCETYFPDTFSLGWSADHLAVIKQVETSVLRGGLAAFAMPRGSGKTSLSEAAVEWAIVEGHRDFVLLVGSSAEAAQEMLDSIKTELETNELLAEDYPEVCVPIQALEGIAIRANGQHIGGKRTHIGWTGTEVVLPTVEGSRASGAILRVAGITGRIRGMKFKRADGKTVRPSLVIVDDPQTDESARSLSQCEQRERILAGAILGLAGPGKKIAGVMPCTVIRPGDMADRILDREKHPQWRGRRTKLVYAFPTNTALWDQYAQIRADSLRNGGEGAEATQFYLENREAMDAGAKVAWEERKEDGDISAIQHAMNLKFQDERAFFAEYQNEPLPDEGEDDGLIEQDELMRKLSGYKRGVVPSSCTTATMFIDVQGSCLWWMVMAFAQDFTGTIIDYGAWPDQRSDYYTMRTLKRTLARAKPGAGLEGQIRNGLDKLCDEQLTRDFLIDASGGETLRIQRCIIDANWGDSTDVVKAFCRESEHSQVLIPGHGTYYGARTRQFHEYKRKPGDRLGHRWLVPRPLKGAVRHVRYDVNYWKSFLHQRLLVPIGDPGCVTLYGKNPRTHQMLAEQLLAERRTLEESKVSQVWEWTHPDKNRDNHLLDAAVGCCVAASMVGCELPNAGGNRSKARTKKRIRLSERQKR